MQVASFFFDGVSFPAPRSLRRGLNTFLIKSLLAKRDGVRVLAGLISPCVDIRQLCNLPTAFSTGKKERKGTISRAADPTYLLGQGCSVFERPKFVPDLPLSLRSLLALSPLPSSLSRPIIWLCISPRACEINGERGNPGRARLDSGRVFSLR